MRLLELDQILQHAEHAFGTINESEKNTDPDELIRAYTEILGPIAHMRQVHGSRIVYTNDPGCIEEADAIYTDNPDLWLAVKTADCVPVLISTPHAVAAVHCGWRGLEAEILPQTIKVLMDEYNISAADVFIHIGPCISQSMYEVEEHYKKIFDEKFFKPAGKKGYTLMDLSGIVTAQAREMDVPKSHIIDSGLCTYQDKDLFHSYRRSKKEGDEGYNVQCSLVKRYEP
jgi:YfiH family protein